MKNYDFIVLGAGSVNEFAFESAAKGFKVAMIDEGHPGGTCLNRGCIPTKVMLQSADVAHYAKNGQMYGINSKIESIDFSVIKNRVNDIVGFWRAKLYEAIKNSPTLDFYQHSASFTAEKTLEVGGEKIRGNKIIIGVGMRPFIPQIEGLENVDYLTNENILSLTSLPKSIAILGGGYIGMEFAHFFSALGSKVFVIEMKESLLSELDPFLSSEFNKFAAEQMNIFVSSKLERIEKNGDYLKLHCTNKNDAFEISAEKLLIASGRIVNSDKIKPENTGIQTDRRGFIITDEYMRAKADEIWAAGDCIGTPAFRHTANYQVEILINNILNGKRIKPDYSITPAAVFTHPEIATVGLSEKSAREKFKNVSVKRLGYFGNAKGKAIGYKGFCTAVINTEDSKILGFHIIGPYASILIHEILPVMTAGLTFKDIEKTIHIHPALSELVAWTFSAGKEV